jgi:hypothetical protein
VEFGRGGLGHLHVCFLLGLYCVLDFENHEGDLIVPLSSSRFDDTETFVDLMVAVGRAATQLVSLSIQIASSID